LLEQALLQTSLKLGPEANALRSLLSELAGTYSRTRRVNASNAAGIRAATEQARPQVGSAFEQALASTQAQRAALGVAGTDPQAAAFERRVGEQRANALNDLTARSRQAEEGRVFANQTARDEYLSGKQKITGQLTGLAGEQGAQTQALYDSLKDKQRARALTRRGQDITVRGQDIASRDRRAAAAERKRKEAEAKKGPKLASQEQHAAAKDGIDAALTWIRRLSQSSMTSPQIRDLLGAGGSITVSGQQVKIPQFAKDYINAAYDLQVNGGLSRANVAALHRRRLSIKRLGYKTVTSRGGEPALGAGVGASGSADLSG
jgi:hypothetical protein